MAAVKVAKLFLSNALHLSALRVDLFKWIALTPRLTRGRAKGHRSTPFDLFHRTLRVIDKIRTIHEENL